MRGAHDLRRYPGVGTHIFRHFEGELRLGAARSARLVPDDLGSLRVNQQRTREGGFNLYLRRLSRFIYLLICRDLRHVGEGGAPASVRAVGVDHRRGARFSVRRLDTQEIFSGLLKFRLCGTDAAGESYQPLAARYQLFLNLPRHPSVALKYHGLARAAEERIFHLLDAGGFAVNGDRRGAEGERFSGVGLARRFDAGHHRRGIPGDRDRLVCPAPSVVHNARAYREVEH